MSKARKNVDLIAKHGLGFLRLGKRKAKAETETETEAQKEGKKEEEITQETKDG